MGIRALYRFLGIVFALIGISACAPIPERPLAPVINAWYQPQAEGFYRVKPDDTLYSIAWAYGLDYRALAKANHLQPPYRLWVNQQLTMVIAPTATASAKIPAATPTVQAPTVPPKQWVWPAKGRLMAPYSGALMGNHGLDIAGVFDSPVRAASSGVVVYSGDKIQGYGNLIIIKHNATYMSAYADNQRLLVKLGQSVVAGQMIARMGRNNQGQPQLHFEIRRDGKPVNPLNYLR